MVIETVGNFIGGQWVKSTTTNFQDVINPASAEIIGRTPLSTGAEVDAAVQAAQAAFQVWSKVPPGERSQYLYKMKSLLEIHREELARLITLECGKTLDESRGELQRAIENVEVACGIPTLLQGKISEDIARGIDETLLRQPVGVCAGIMPFNFPGMIPFWFLPYAIACGNPFIVKPSEKVPLTMAHTFKILEELDIPKGVLSLVNGGKEAVDALLTHPLVRGISFVGSTPVARYIFSQAAANGKRAQCQGGAKNPIVILPDCDLEMTTRIVADSAFGCAGQRCLAASLAITVGNIGETFKQAIAETAASRVTGNGLDEKVQMGPVISEASRKRIEEIITKGISEGAQALVDGRDAKTPGYENGYFVRPTVLDQVRPDSTVGKTEIFGPVLGLIHVDTIEEAIQLINRGTYGNMASLFTNSGAAARKFRNEVAAGNIGINIGVAAPIAYFPFSGWKDSFFGDLHAQSSDGIDFFTQKKVVIERWPKEWSRKF